MSKKQKKKTREARLKEFYKTHTYDLSGSGYDENGNYIFGRWVKND